MQRDFNLNKKLCGVPFALFFARYPFPLNVVYIAYNAVLMKNLGSYS